MRAATAPVREIAIFNTPEILSSPVGRIIEEHHNDRNDLIAMLLDIQDAMGFLPRFAMEHVATRLEIPVTEVYGIATFFKYFRLKPPGEHQCTVCTGTACHVRGAARVLREFERHLGIRSGEVTDDREYGLETVNCVGACALGPIVLVDGDYQGQVTASKVPTLLRRLKRSAEKKPVAARAEAAA